jgi:hypothetical protein
LVCWNARHLEIVVTTCFAPTSAINKKVIPIAAIFNKIDVSQQNRWLEFVLVMPLFLSKD